MRLEHALVLNRYFHALFGARDGVRSAAGQGAGRVRVQVFPVPWPALHGDLPRPAYDGPGGVSGRFERLCATTEARRAIAARVHGVRAGRSAAAGILHGHRQRQNVVAAREPVAVAPLPAAWPASRCIGEARRQAAGVRFHPARHAERGIVGAALEGIAAQWRGRGVAGGRPLGAADVRAASSRDRNQQTRRGNQRRGRECACAANMA